MSSVIVYVLVKQELLYFPFSNAYFMWEECVCSLKNLVPIMLLLLASLSKGTSVPPSSGLKAALRGYCLWTDRGHWPKMAINLYRREMHDRGYTAMTPCETLNSKNINTQTLVWMASNSFIYMCVYIYTHGARQFFTWQTSLKTNKHYKHKSKLYCFLLLAIKSLSSLLF